MKKHFLVHININLITHQISRALWFHQDNMPTRYQIYREIDSHMYELLSITTFSEEEYFYLENLC